MRMHVKKGFKCRKSGLSLKTREQTNNSYLRKIQGKKGKKRRKVQHSGPGQYFAEYP